MESPSHHIRRSYKSLASRALQQGEAVDADLLFCGETEFSYSTPALVSLLAWWSACPSQRDGAGENQAAAQLSMGLMVNKIIGNRSFELDLGKGLVKIQEGRVCLAPWSQEWEHLGRSPRFRGETMAVTEVLISLARFQMKCSKVSDGTKHEGKVFFSRLAIALGFIFEYTVEFTTADDFMALPVIRFTSGKSRRISQGVKQAVLQSTRDAAGVHNISQLVSSIRIVQKRKGENLNDELVSRTSKRFCRDNMFQYMTSGLLMFSRTGHCNAVYDGTRIDNDELTSFLFFNPQGQVGCWGPPQALRGEMFVVNF